MTQGDTIDPQFHAWRGIETGLEDVRSCKYEVDLMGLTLR